MNGWALLPWLSLCPWRGAFSQVSHRRGRSTKIMPGFVMVFCFTPLSLPIYRLSLAVASQGSSSHLPASVWKMNAPWLKVGSHLLLLSNFLFIPCINLILLTPTIASKAAAGLNNESGCLPELLGNMEGMYLVSSDRLNCRPCSHATPLVLCPWFISIALSEENKKYYKTLT